MEKMIRSTQEYVTELIEFFDKKIDKLDKKIEKYKKERKEIDKNIEFLILWKKTEVMDKDRLVIIESDETIYAIDYLCDKIYDKAYETMRDIFFHIKQIISKNFASSPPTHRRAYGRYYDFFCKIMKRYEVQEIEDIKKSFTRYSDDDMAKDYFLDSYSPAITNDIRTFFINLLRIKNFKNVAALKVIVQYTDDIMYGIDIFNLLSQCKRQGINTNHFTRVKKHYNEQFLSIPEIVNSIDKSRIEYPLDFANDLFMLLEFARYNKMPKPTKRQILAKSTEIKTANYMFKTAKKTYRDKYDKLLLIKKKQKKRGAILDLKGNPIPQETLEILKKPLTNEEKIFLEYSNPSGLELKAYNPNIYHCYEKTAYQG
jgi:hypothetical protein